MADYRAQRLARILADYERFTAHSNPMTDNNLIPPPELVQQWATASPVQSNDENWAYEARAIAIVLALPRPHVAMC